MDIINHWFKPSADIGIEGYEYVKNEKKVVPNKSNVLSNLDEDWEQSIRRYDDDTISEYDSDEDDEYGGFAIEFGELKIGDDNIQSNIDDSASTGTMNLPKPERFIDFDNKSDLSENKEKLKVAINLSEEFYKQSEELPPKKGKKLNDNRMDIEISSTENIDEERIQTMDIQEHSNCKNKNRPIKTKIIQT